MQKKTQTVYGLYYLDGVELPMFIGTAEEIAQFFKLDKRQCSISIYNSLKNGAVTGVLFILGRYFTICKMWEQDKVTEEIIYEYTDEREDKHNVQN